ARLDIEEALSPSTDSSVVIARDRDTPSAGWRHVVPWVVAAAAGTALALVLVFGWTWREPPVPARVRLSADPGGGAAIVISDARSSITLSPDGTRLAFVAHRASEATSRPYLRPLDQLQ